MPELSIILVNYNESAYLAAVLTALRDEFPSTETEVLVVDNCSTDSSVTLIRESFPEAKLILAPANLFYGKGANLGLAEARGSWFLVLNPDTAWEPGQLRRLWSAAKKYPSLGLAAPQLRYLDGQIQVSAHHRFPTAWTVFVDYCLPLQQLFMRRGGHPYQESVARHRQTHQIAHASGACLLVARTVYERLGGYDPKFSMYLEETEWQKRMADAGIERWLISESHITHFGSAQKTFAQASTMYLWGLRWYAHKHWRRPFRQARLDVAIIIGSLVSIVTLLIAWPFSLLYKRIERRVRHYLRSYLSLLPRLFRLIPVA